MLGRRLSAEQAFLRYSNMTDDAKRIQNLSTIFLELSHKFAANLRASMQVSLESLERAERKARMLGDYHNLLLNCANSNSQRELATIPIEIFAALVCSLHFSASGLDKPGQGILRRVLELGIAVVYLWDLPHAYYGWKEHDKDLNFNDMLDHLRSAEYKSFLRAEIQSYTGGEFVDTSALHQIYRRLSNTIHGKLATLEVVLHDRFQHSALDWANHLALVLTVEDAIARLWQSRFSHAKFASGN